MTRRSGTYTPAQQAAALAQVTEAGGSLRGTSRELGIPLTTLRAWVLQAAAAGRTVPVAAERGEQRVAARAERWEQIAELWPVYLEEHLQVTLAVLSYIRGHEEWIAAQDAHGLATLVGVLGDKARLLTEAMERATQRGGPR